MTKIILIIEIEKLRLKMAANQSFLANRSGWWKDSFCALFEQVHPVGNPKTKALGFAFFNGPARERLKSQEMGGHKGASWCTTRVPKWLGNLAAGRVADMSEDARYAGLQSWFGIRFAIEQLLQRWTMVGGQWFTKWMGFYLLKIFGILVVFCIHIYYIIITYSNMSVKVTKHFQIVLFFLVFFGWTNFVKNGRFSHGAGHVVERGTRRRHGNPGDSAGFRPWSDVESQCFFFSA